MPLPDRIMPLPDRSCYSEVTREATQIHRFHTVEKMQLRESQSLDRGLNYLCNTCSSLTQAAWIAPSKQIIDSDIMFEKCLVVSPDSVLYAQIGTSSEDTRDEPAEEPWRHHSLRDLMHSARQGCRLCYVIWHSLELSFYTGGHPKQLEAIIANPILAATCMGTPILRKEETFPKLEFLYMPKDTCKPYDEIVATLELTDLPANHAVVHVEPAPDLHRKDFKNIRSWLRRCRSKHGYCDYYSRKLGKVFPRIQPSRIILVSIHHEVVQMKLLSGSDFHKDAHYATLSYCWGKKGASANLKLTRANEAKFMVSIPVAKTPKTIVDAAIVTVRLGLKYLWVDALCIMQDDGGGDWRHEAPLMPQIYANGYVNLAAESATNCNGGLNLSRHDKMEVNPLVLDLQWHELPQGRFQVEAPALHTTCIYRSPLSSRAWTLQENVLGFRTIHFARDYVRWTCMATSACDTGKQSFSSHAGSFDGIMASKGLWMEMVKTDYKSRLISWESDRLVALAGIAQLWASAKGFEADDYLAGIWKPNLWYEILWIPSDESIPQTENIAPSWSWASLEGHILFRVTKCASLLGPPTYAPHAQFNLLEASIEHGGTGSFGSVQSGALRMEGMLRRVKLADPIGINFDFDTMTEYRDVFESLSIGQQIYRKTTARIGDKYTDETISEYLDDSRMLEELVCECFFLPLAKMTREVEESEMDGIEVEGSEVKGKSEVEGLLLQPVKGNQGQYRRIGVLQAHFLKEGSTKMRELWEVGCQLEPENYQRDCGGGVYEFTII